MRPAHSLTIIRPGLDYRFCERLKRYITGEKLLKHRPQQERAVIEVSHFVKLQRYFQSPTHSADSSMPFSIHHDKEKPLYRDGLDPMQSFDVPRSPFRTRARVQSEQFTEGRRAAIRRVRECEIVSREGAEQLPGISAVHRLVAGEGRADPQVHTGLHGAFQFPDPASFAEQDGQMSISAESGHHEL